MMRIQSFLSSDWTILNLLSCTILSLSIERILESVFLTQETVFVPTYSQNFTCSGPLRYADPLISTTPTPLTAPAHLFHPAGQVHGLPNHHC